MAGSSGVPTDVAVRRAVQPAVPVRLVPPALFNARMRQPSAAVARHARLRGQAFRTLLGAIGASCDTAALGEVLGLLPPEAEALLRRGDMVGTAWYPVGWFAALHGAAQAVTGRGPELARELGRESMRMDARGIYRFVLRFISPESLFTHAQSVLGLYLDGPKLTVTAASSPSAGDGYIAFRLDNALGYDGNVWQGMLGASEALIELSGGRAPLARCLDGGGEASWIAADVSWTR